MFDADKLPHAFTVGKVGSNFYFDMNNIEYKATETCFMGVTDQAGNILEFEKLGKI